MRYLIRMVSFDDLKGRLLPSVRTLAGSVGVVVRSPKWTSYGALEIDVFAPSKADLDTFLAAVEPLGTLEFARDLNVAPSHRSCKQLFSEARVYFNSERYWECHEALEAAWRLLSGEEKLYVQGLILVCAALVHHQKGVVLGEAGVRLRRQSPHSVDKPFDINGFDLNLHFACTDARAYVTQAPNSDQARFRRTSLSLYFLPW